MGLRLSCLWETKTHNIVYELYELVWFLPSGNIGDPCADVGDFYWAWTRLVNRHLVYSQLVYYPQPIAQPKLSGLGSGLGFYMLGIGIKSVG